MLALADIYPLHLKNRRTKMLGLQVVFGLCIFVAIALGYLIPVLVSKIRRDKIGRPKNPRLVQGFSSCCNCTSAGVFIAMFFLGLLPSIRQKTEVILRRLEISTDFPATECVIVMGYFLTLFVQQLFLMCKKNKPIMSLSQSQEMEQRESLLNEFELDSMSPSSAMNDEINFASPAESTRGVEKHTPPKISNGCEHSHITILYERSSGLQFVILVFATSLHAVFEGITLALQTNVSRALHLFIAILVHECLVALALGVNTTKLKLPLRSVIKFSLVFSLAVPIGIVVGLAIGRTPGSTGEIISAVIQGMAAGTFLHVTFQELIPSEFNIPTNRMLKLLSLLSGFVFFAVVTYFLVD